MAFVRGLYCLNLCKPLTTVCTKTASNLVDNASEILSGQQNQPRSFTTSSILCKNYYDVLEITPKATSAQVKSSYYRLSKKYHPDVNKTSQAQYKFSEISEAYQVLGNKKKRLIYDRGMWNPTDNYPGGNSSASNEDISYRDFIRNRGQFNERKQAPTGKWEHYDFDEFYRQHYGESMRRHQQYAQNKIQMEKDSKEMRHAARVGLSLYLMCFVALYFEMWRRRRQDMTRPRPPPTVFRDR